MQIDMHYYGTFALARAAGLNAQAAGTIAYAAQYVDDSIDAEVTEHEDGARIQPELTAHHPHGLSELREIRDADDQRRVWVPFHFLPGGEGETKSQRLLCRKDSPIARDMVADTLDQADRAHALELAGIVAHVYVDTFAHYGFSGVSSRANRVVNDEIEVHNDAPAIRKYLGDRVTAFLRKYGEQGGLIRNFRALIGSAGELASGALGHGAVATYPDQPYLRWSFRYQYPEVSGIERSDRDNHADFVDGAQALFGMFRELVRRRPDLADPAGGRDFDAIRPVVEELLSTEGNSAQRTAAWQEAVGRDRLYEATDGAIPEYDRQAWDAARDRLPQLARSGLATQHAVYRLFQAAELHRAYVLRDLLPRHGIVVI